MIAPIDGSLSEAGQKTQALHSARRVAASALLDTQGPPHQPAKPVARWQAWLFLAWAAITTATYLAHMLGIIN